MAGSGRVCVALRMETVGSGRQRKATRRRQRYAMLNGGSNTFTVELKRELMPAPD